MKHKKQLRRKDAATTNSGQGTKLLLELKKACWTFRLNNTFLRVIRCFIKPKRSTTVASYIRKVVLFRLQAKQRKLVKIQFKLHPAKLHSKLNFDEKFQQWQRKRLNERTFWLRWERRRHYWWWNALLKLREESLMWNRFNELLYTSRH